MLAPKPDAEGTFASWLLGQADTEKVSIKAEASSVDLHTELIECLERVHSEPDIPHAMGVLHKVEQASEHILGAFPRHRVESTRTWLSADMPEQTWNWWEPVTDFRKNEPGLPVYLDNEEAKHSLLPIAKIKPEMLEFSDCELPSISTEWGARFREEFFGGFVPIKTSEEKSTEPEKTPSAVKALFLRTHSILRNVWLIGRMVSIEPKNYYGPCFRDDVALLWRAFGRLLGFTIEKDVGVYSSDLNGIGKCGLVLQFPRVPNYVISVQFEFYFECPKFATEFLSTLLALTSGLNFEDWVWDAKKGPSPRCLPIGLMLCPLGVVRAQYQTHSKRYVCDKLPIWEEQADELVFELLSKYSRAEQPNKGCFELCSSPMPHDTVEHHEGKSSRLSDSLLIHTSKQIVQKEWGDEEDEGDQGFVHAEEDLILSDGDYDAEERSSSKRRKPAILLVAQPTASGQSAQGWAPFNCPGTSEEGDAEKENKNFCSPLMKEKQSEVKQWPLNAYFLSQLGKLSREENFERWRKTKGLCATLTL